MRAYRNRSAIVLAFVVVLIIAARFVCQHTANMNKKHHHHQHHFHLQRRVLQVHTYVHNVHATAYMHACIAHVLSFD